MIRKIGGYEITGQIGRGGFGSVYRGLDPGINQVVAIKVMSPSTDPGTATRFRTEAETAARISHPNVVTIFRFGDEQGVPYLVMEFLDGLTLQELITQRTPLSLFDKIEIMRQTASGLHCAHEKGVVHRDVKPANIMRLRTGQVKIMDFGIARAFNSDSTRLTQTGFMIGTIEYMAPEQFRSSEPDLLCDVWSFGVVFYELLAGIHPCYSRDRATKLDPYMMMHKITTEDPVPIGDLVPGVTPALSRVINNLLARDRAQRYQALDDVLLDLDPIQKELGLIQIPEYIRQAEAAANSDNIEHAQSMIRRVLELDAGNKQARVIRDAIRERARQAANRPKVEELVRQADEEIRQRHFETALSHLQSALKLDPVSNTLKQRIENLKEKERQARKSDSLLNQAREHLSQGDFTGARQRASEAIENDPENSQASSFLTTVDRAIADRERQNRLQIGLVEVNNLIVIQAYDEALKLLDALIEHVGDDPQLLRRLEEVRQLKEAQKKKDLINEGIHAARDLLKAEKFSEACQQLEQLNRQSPNDPAIELLLNNARERAQGQKLQRKVEAIVRQANQEREANLFDQAIRTLQQAIDLDPLNGNVLTLQRRIFDELRSEREKQKLDSQLAEIQALSESGRLPEAKTAVDRMLALYPSNQHAASLAAEIDKAIATREDSTQKAFKKEIEDAEGYLRSGHLESATSVLESLKDRFSDNEAVTKLFQEAQRLSSNRQRESEIQATLSEVRALVADSSSGRAIEKLKEGLRRYSDSREYLDELSAIESSERWNRNLRTLSEAVERERFEDALSLAGEMLRKRPGDLQVSGLHQSAKRESSLRNLVNRVGALIEAGDFDSADGQLKKGLEEFGQDARLLKSAEEVRKEALRRKQLRLAASALRNRDFDLARKSIRTVLDLFPDDSAARELQDDINAEEAANTKRRGLQEGRRAFETLLKAQRFDEAIRAIQLLIERFADEGGLLEELERAKGARDQVVRRADYNRSREEVQQILNDCRFEDAIELLNKLLVQYPGDPLFTADLRIANETLELLKRRGEIDAQVAEIESLFKVGNAASVRKSARAMLAETEEPRARELLNWAERTLSQATAIRNQGKNRKTLLYAGVGAVLAIAALAIWPPPPPPPDPLSPVTVSPSELTFHYRTGDTVPEPQSIQAHIANKTQAWIVSTNSKWLSASPVKGQGSSTIEFRVNPSGLKPGKEREVASLISGASTKNVLVGFEIEPDRRRGPEQLQVKPPSLTFTYQIGGVPPKPERVRIEPSLPDLGRRWSISKDNSWIQLKKSAGQGIDTPWVSIDPKGLAPGEYRSAITVDMPNQRKKVDITLKVLPNPITFVNPAINPVPGGGSPLNTNPPVVNAPVTSSKPLPPLPVAVDCFSPKYHGTLNGSIVWTGDLAPNETVTIQRPKVASSGKIEGDLPGCEVEVAPNKAVTFVQSPAQSNHFSQIVVKNSSGSNLNSIRLNWTAKEPLSN